MKKRLLFGILLFTAGLGLSGQAGLRIFFIRHAQVGGNVTKEWADTPAGRRPAYAGNWEAFTPLGEQQTADLPDKLAPYEFALIAVGPLWRTRHTILPYLKARNRRAEIWPELIEFGPQDGDASLIGTPDLPPPSADILTGGRKIQLPAEERPYFTLREEGVTEPKLGHAGTQGAADLTFMLNRVIRLLLAKYGGSDESVLLVGHSGAGWCLLQLLARDRETLKQGLANAGLWMVEEQPDGTFRIMIANGEPVTHPHPGAAESPAQPSTGDGARGRD